ncbi:uncharacterized protein M421DRAFT_70919 [Didymella exigua CBS 183.55]|uniref:Uncharacterized protein n=1 Tax=Didymella exigua CBS 183.55 TaxID=1150837 RepID=A0A6A5RF56_9PLEO|nr:uncharacterized protein M421DRAFT_70919 [Didymella exigua CBS 183.55]KAF1925146.1 hypothetical protein M421DRAFT_70919 [Didymella exigua CBS 183.55]
MLCKASAQAALRLVVVKILDHSLEGGFEEMINTLLNAGAKVNAQGGGFGNALYAASARGDKQVVQMLLNAGTHQQQEDNTILVSK